MPFLRLNCRVSRALLVWLMSWIDLENFATDVHLNCGFGRHNAVRLSKATLHEPYEKACLSYTTVSQQNRLETFLHASESSKLLGLHRF